MLHPDFLALMLLRNQQDKNWIPNHGEVGREGDTAASATRSRTSSVFVLLQTHSPVVQTWHASENESVVLKTKQSSQKKKKNPSLMYPSSTPTNIRHSITEPLICI